MSLPPFFLLEASMSNRSEVFTPVSVARASAVAVNAQSGQVGSAKLVSPTDNEVEVEVASEQWTEQGILQLHGVLYDTCVEKLGDPETPLDEVLDWLRWVFSAPERENTAFSFISCLKLYQRPNPRALREAILTGVKNYLAQRLSAYPDWVAAAFWANPDWFAAQLDRHPQWLNEQLRERSTTCTADFFQ
jgi:hypothetical protein